MWEETGKHSVISFTNTVIIKEQMENYLLFTYFLSINTILEVEVCAFSPIVAALAKA